MRKFLRWVWSLLEVIIIVYVIVLTSFLLCRNKYGYTQFGDYTFNNIDLLDEKNIANAKNGDLLIVKNSNDIQKGDVIYYYAVYNESYIMKTSPVLDIQSDDYSYLYTVDDSGNVNITGTKVIGKYANTYAHLGTALEILESRLGFLFGVLLPIMIVFIYQVYEFVVIIRYERVEDAKEIVSEINDNEEKKESPKEETEKKNVSEEVKEEQDNSEKQDDQEDDDIEIL